MRRTQATFAALLALCEYSNGMMMYFKAVRASQGACMSLCSPVPMSSRFPTSSNAGVVAQPVVRAAVFVNPHNGMTFFYNDPHKTVPRDATTASLETAQACICSDADPRPDATLTVTYNCYHQALYGNCDAEFMSGALEELVETDGAWRFRRSVGCRGGVVQCWDGQTCGCLVCAGG